MAMTDPRVLTDRHTAWKVDIIVRTASNGVCTLRFVQVDTRDVEILGIRGDQNAPYIVVLHAVMPLREFFRWRGSSIGRSLGTLNRGQ